MATNEALVLIGALTLLACEGALGAGSGGAATRDDLENGRGGAGSGDGDAFGDGDGDVGSALDCDAPMVEPRVLPRLTSRQFALSVNHVFERGIDVGDTFPESTLGAGFRTAADANIVSADGAMGILEAAERVSEQLTQDVTDTLGCTPDASNAEPCVSEFIVLLLDRAYRRAPTEEEVARLSTLYETVAPASTPREGVRAVIEATLQSPQFLYQVEQVPDGASAGEIVRVEGRLLANRLSYLLAERPPDEALLELAESGELDDPDVVAEQARRLVAEYGTGELVADFFEDFMRIDRLALVEKDIELFPQFGDLEPHMREQFRRYVSGAFSSSSTLAELLTSTRIPIDEEMAEFHGVGAPGEGWETVDLGPERPGLLALPLFLAAQSNSATTSPVARGAFIREALLCQELTPPAGIDINLPPSRPGESVRERLATHASDPSCSTCHSLIDPPGFSLENFDAIGGYRTHEETGVPVDASGELIHIGDGGGPFDGAQEMISMLADSSLVQDCFARQWVRFSLGRHDTESDACSVATVRDHFDAAGARLDEVLVAITQTDAFLYRVIPEVQ